MLISQRSRVRLGFTLVEMMVTVAIFAIVMAIGAPNFSSFIQNAGIRTAAENLQAGIALARTEALRRNTNVTLWLVGDISASCALTNTGTSWVVSMDVPTGACANAVSETVSPRIIQTRAGSDGSNGVAVSALTGASPASCLTFNSFGRAQATCTGGSAPLARIVFSTASAGSRSLEMRVDAGGASRLCDPARTGLAGC